MTTWIVLCEQPKGYPRKFCYLYDAVTCDEAALLYTSSSGQSTGRFTVYEVLEGIEYVLQVQPVAASEARKPDPPCEGPGYAHKPHGDCPGYGTDRT